MKVLGRPRAPGGPSDFAALPGFEDFLNESLGLRKPVRPAPVT